MPKTARDIMTPNPITVAPGVSVTDAAKLMVERSIGALPVVENGEVCGLVTVQALAGRYVENVNSTGFASRPVTVRRLVEALDGTLRAGSPDTELAGAVLIGANEPETVKPMSSRGSRSSMTICSPVPMVRSIVDVGAAT